MKICIYTTLILVLFSGCSTKIYQEPALNFTIKDAKTKLPIKNTKLSGGIKNGILAISNIQGAISYDGDYERRYHAYPFPIISHGSLEKSIFTLSHPNYSKYSLNCSFTTLGGSCYLDIKKLDKTKKDILFKCIDCGIKK